MKDIKTILQELNSITDLNKENVMAKMVDVLNTNDPHLKLSAINGRFTLKITNRGSLISEEEATFEMCTLLHVAAASNNERMVKLLIELGADVNSKDACDLTPLHYAAMYGKTEIEKLLIEKGAEVDPKDTFSRTPLYYALGYAFIKDNLKTASSLTDRLKTAKLLINNGADKSCITHIHKPKAVKTGIVAGVLDAIIISLVLPYTTELSDLAIIGAIIASTLIVGIIAYNIAYKWSERKFNSKLDEISLPLIHNNQLTDEITKGSCG